jgi:SAM-dependent methyltransferase
LERQRAFVPALRELLAAELGARRVDILEVSPDPAVTNVLRPLAREYRASNHVNPAAGELQLDLQDLALPDASFDLIVMSYVLCCVPDDRRAAASMWRVLRPGGLVVACEAFSPSPEEHDEWGARGHGGGWRQYGLRGLASRFSPFEVRVVDATNALSPAERTRRGVGEHEYIIVLRKSDD